MRDLYDELCTYFQTKPDRRGWAHADCPFCGKETEKHKPHFSFTERGFDCRSCGAHGNLKELAVKLGLWESDQPVTIAHRAPRPPREPEPEPEWKANAEEWLNQYVSHPQRYELWAQYKPVNRMTINKYLFGVGILPGQRTTRLIVPIIQGGKILSFRGRYIGTPPSEDIPSWIGVEGGPMAIWGLDDIQPGDTVWICENYVDAAWLMQEMPNHGQRGQRAIALGGARVFKPEEVSAVLAKRPASIVVAYDNDLAGQANDKTRVQMLAERQAKLRKRNPHAVLTNSSEGAGIQTYRLFSARGVKTYMLKWPEIAPPKADVGWAIRNNLYAC